jgi:predicted RNase H-like nuclease (RuvC/YqgF family)
MAQKERPANPELLRAVKDSIDPIKMLEKRMAALEARVSHVKSLERRVEELHTDNQVLRARLRHRDTIINVAAVALSGRSKMLTDICAQILLLGGRAMPSRIRYKKCDRCADEKAEDRFYRGSAVCMDCRSIIQREKRELARANGFSARGNRLKVGHSVGHSAPKVGANMSKVVARRLDFSVDYEE